MTYEEAKDHLICGRINCLTDMDKDEELRYVCLKALEKQIPKNLIPSKGLYKQLRGNLYPLTCPNCKCGFTRDADYEHCPKCGQAIDWSDTDDTSTD